MAIFAKFLSRLDDSELAAFGQHFVCFERSALHALFISDIYFDGARGSAKLVDKRAFHRLVNSFSVIIYHAVCQRLVGVLVIFNFGSEI